MHILIIVALNEAGDTPLSLACSHGTLKMVMALINSHVDPKGILFIIAVTLLMVVFCRASQQCW